MLRNRSKLQIWVVSLLVMMLIAACGTPAPAPGPASGDAPTGEEAAGGTLTIARPTDAVSLDPKVETTSPGNWVMSNIYETLVVLNADLEFEPGLAESWEVVEEDRWRFTLREGVTFHDGTPFNAESVIYSFARQQDPDNPGRSASNLAPIIAVEAVDEYTVDFVTDGPYGPLLNILALVYTGGIVSPTAVEASGEDFGRNPVGTGPFQFVEWRTNDSITIERYDGYWGTPANLEQVVYRVIPEESARMLALETGEVQMVMQPAPSQLPMMADDPNFTIFETPGARVIFFGMVTDRAPLDDVRVRTALNLGFDKQSIVDNILEGAGFPPEAYISPPIFGFSDVSEYFAYAPEQADALLVEAGWEDRDGDGIRENEAGETLSLVHFSPRGRYLKDAESGEAFQAAMLELGVEVDLEVMEWGTLFEQIRQPDLPANLFTLGWSTATGDADYTLGPVFGCDSFPPNAWNSMQYCNEEVDALIAEARTSTDLAERQDLYAQALEILAQDAVWVPVFNTKEVIATTANVEGFVQHPIDYFLWLDTVSLE